MDNGKEFDNKQVQNFCQENNIQIKYSIPYFHESNGRVERAIRTLRDALKRTRGTLKAKLPKILAAYNNAKHRGIGTSPIEALKEENSYEVLKHQETL